MAFLDNDGLLYFWQRIKTMLSGKVDKVDGKGLSTNDYTTAEKNKLEGLSNYSLPKATATQLGGIKVGENLTVTDGVLSAIQGSYTLPTASAIQLGGIKVGTNLSINANGVLSSKDTTYSVASASANGLMSSGDKSKLDGFGSASSYALKSEITGMYRYKGSVANVSALPSGASTGDVYNVESGGMNYAWNGDEWDSLGEIFTITSITNGEIDTIVAS